MVVPATNSGGSIPESALLSRSPAVRASSFTVGELSDDGGVVISAGGGGSASPNSENGSSANNNNNNTPDDRYNYALLILLYTLQGIPMGLSASIPFLIQSKVKMMTSMAAASAADATTASAAVSSAAAHAAKLSYNANAIFALCSWPFSLKLLWAPIVDSIFFKRFGRRKSWLVPVQTISGFVMVFGANFVERQLGLGGVASSSFDEAGRIAEETSRDLRMAASKRNLASSAANNDDNSVMNVRGVTAFFQTARRN